MCGRGGIYTSGARPKSTGQPWRMSTCITDVLGFFQLVIGRSVLLVVGFEQQATIKAIGI
jgi:hypothetical protein